MQKEEDADFAFSIQLILFFLQRSDATYPNCLSIDISVSLPLFQQGK